MMERAKRRRRRRKRRGTETKRHHHNYQHQNDEGAVVVGTDAQVVSPVCFQDSDEDSCNFYINVAPPSPNEDLIERPERQQVTSVKKRLKRDHQASTTLDNKTMTAKECHDSVTDEKELQLQQVNTDKLTANDQLQTGIDYTRTTCNNSDQNNINQPHSLGPTQHQQHHVATFTDLQLDQLSNLIKIIRNGNFSEFIEILEKRGFKSNLLNVFVDGHTALHYSLIYGRSLAWCKQLVSNGANPNLTNRAGWHPIHLAAYSGSPETLRYLIDHVAN